MRSKTRRYLLLGLVCGVATSVRGGVATSVRDGDVFEQLVSSVTLGSNPTTTQGQCIGNTYATDSKSWPANGSYVCPQGPYGNTAASPNPLVASAILFCPFGFRTCEPTFATAGTGTDEQGAFAAVSATQRALASPSGCSSDTPTYFKSHATNVYDTSSLCTQEVEVVGRPVKKLMKAVNRTTNVAPASATTNHTSAPRARARFLWTLPAMAFHSQTQPTVFSSICAQVAHLNFFPGRTETVTMLGSRWTATGTA
jgi:hypothetical protein